MPHPCGATNPRHTPSLHRWQRTRLAGVTTLPPPPVTPSPHRRSYALYNHAARKLHVRLAQLGAGELCPRGLADEQSPSGLEGDVDAWLRDSLWPAAFAAFRPGGATSPPAEGDAADAPRCLATRFRVRRAGAGPGTCSAASPADARPEFLSAVAPPRAYRPGEAGGPAPSHPELAPAAAGPAASSSSSSPPAGSAAASLIAGSGGAVRAVVTTNERITAEGWSQETRHVRLALDGSGSAFRAGDVCCVQPRNDHHSAALRRLAQHLGLGWDDVLEVNLAEPALHGRSVRDFVEAGSDACLSMLRAHAAAAVAGGARPAVAPTGGGGPTAPWAPGQVFAGRALPLHAPAALPAVVTVSELFCGCLDLLGRPRRSAFEQLSFFATDEEEAAKLREVSAPGGGDLYCGYVERESRCWAEVLADFESCRVPLCHLLELVPAVRPRDFSVASSPLASPGGVDLCAAVLAYGTPFGRRKRGLCSAWLAGLRPGARVTVWLRPGALAPLPLGAPSLLVGPGTGVAPLRALLQERSARAAGSPSGSAGRPGPAAGVSEGPGGFVGSWPSPVCLPRLYFGCRRSDSDFYYRGEWRSLVGSGGAEAVRTAFSREGGAEAGADGKLYVQARLGQDAGAVAAALRDDGCAVVVCGSAKRMPSDVHEVLAMALAAGARLPAAEAEAQLQTMRAQGRYVVEAWS